MADRSDSVNVAKSDLETLQWLAFIAYNDLIIRSVQLVVFSLMTCTIQF